MAMPSPAGERVKTTRRDCVTPETTAVSNPKSRPARLAAMMIRSCERARI